MQENKIFKLIFGEIIKPKARLQQTQTDVDENSVFITVDGYFGFVMDKTDLPFNLDKIPQNLTTTMRLTHILKPENLFKPTKHFVLERLHGWVNILENNDRKIHIRQEYLKYFDEAASFYQEKDLGMVVVEEWGNIVGAIMPMRYDEKEQ